MTDTEIYKRAIEQAVDRGFKYEDAFDRDWWFLEDNNDEGICLEWGDKYGVYSVTIERIIFSHAFGKAFWGEEDRRYKIECDCGGVSPHPVLGWHKPECAKSKCQRGFKFHLQQLVISEDRAKYLKGFL